MQNVSTWTLQESLLKSEAIIERVGAKRDQWASGVGGPRYLETAVQPPAQERDRL